MKEPIKVLSCGHDRTIDLSFGPFLGMKKRETHLFCMRCDLHFYKGKEWTKKEWNDYVNDPNGEPYQEPKPKKSFIHFFPGIFNKKKTNDL